MTRRGENQKRGTHWAAADNGGPSAGVLGHGGTATGSVTNTQGTDGHKG